MADRSDNSSTRTNISPPHRDRDGARRRAESQFVVAERRDTQIKKELEAERAASDAKTAKLRALRMAKEEEDRKAAENEPAPAPKVKKAKTVRIWV
ncbi:MAG: hypothetical protein HY243_08785 [Proteobacteria bacterium]|nr:hypothetical protein [Pseudomonadota bacterium]